jgi:paraquat-inducible protein B
MNNMLARMQERLTKTKEAAGGTGGSGGLSGAIEKMNPRLRAHIDLVKELTTKVSDAGKALEAARDEMNSWIDSMASNILSGIDLSTIQQFDEEGKRTGQSLLEGFNKQIEQAGLFGNYLKQLNSEGGPELRDAVAALGPEAGNKLAKEIIDQGLIPTMQSKLVDVQSMAETTAAEMVPPMLVAGVQSAAGYLMTMQAELDESSALLAEMGRKMGATLTEAMVKEIRDVLAAAGFAQSGATAIMAGTASQAGTGMSQSQLIAGSPFLNNTSIAQAIARAIEDSNQRLGRTGQAVLQ